MKNVVMPIAIRYKDVKVTPNTVCPKVEILTGRALRIFYVDAILKKYCSCAVGKSTLPKCAWNALSEGAKVVKMVKRSMNMK